MNESELVDGAEYSGFWTLNGEPHRGFYKSATPPFTNTVGKRVVPIWEHQSSGGLHCALDTLRRVTPEPAPVGAEGKLHQHGCVFCGRITGEIRSYDSRVHGVTRYCVPCGGMEDAPYYLSKEFDAEITRRKQLASGSDSTVPHYATVANSATVGEPAEPELPIERCACGNIANRVDRHPPLKFCNECHAAEVKRLHYEERSRAYEAVRLDERCIAHDMLREGYHAKTLARAKSEQSKAERSGHPRSFPEDAYLDAETCEP